MVHFPVLHLHLFHNLHGLIFCYNECIIRTVLLFDFFNNHLCRIYELFLVNQFLDNSFYLFIFCIFQILSQKELANKSWLLLSFENLLINRSWRNSKLFGNLLDFLMFNQYSVDNPQLFFRFQNRPSSTSSLLNW